MLNLQDYGTGGSSGTDLDLPVSVENGGTGSETALDARTALGVAASSHAHAQADVTGLVAALSGKASTTHAHLAADVTDLGTAATADSTAFAAATHASRHASAGADPLTLAQSQVTNLTADLSAKAAAASTVLDGDAAGGVLGGTYPNPSFAADMATQAELDAHTGDTTAAHAASAVSVAPTGDIAATDVQAALSELDTEKAAAAAAVMDGDTAGGVLSGTYPNPGFASDMATQSELDAHINDSTAAHAASSISFSATGGIASTTVQTAIAELDTEKATAASSVLDGDTAGGVLSGTYPNPGFAADMATQAGLDAHTSDTTAAHSASAISFSPTGTISATDVQAAIAEVATEASAGSTPSTKWEGFAAPDNPAGSTFSQAGMSGPSLTATGTPSNVGWTPRPKNRYTTAAGANSAGGLSTSASIAQLQSLPDLTFVVTPVDTTTIRYWFGLFASTPTSSDSPAIHLIGFRYSTYASDANWMACTKDGTTLTATSTGVAFAASAVTLRVKVVSTSSVEFYVNGTLTNTITTTLPTASTNLQLYAIISNGATGGNKVYDWSLIRMSQGT